MVVLTFDEIIICGDFDIHIDVQSNVPGTEFSNVMEVFNLVQCVSGPAHRRGHTLDLVLTHGRNLNNVFTKDMCVSDN